MNPLQLRLSHLETHLDEQLSHLEARIIKLERAVAAFDEYLDAQISKCHPHDPGPFLTDADRTRDAALDKKLDAQWKEKQCSLQHKLPPS